VNGRQPSLWEDQRLTLTDAIDLSLASVAEYGQRYRHWAIAYSGGKDSTATVALVAWAIQVGKIDPPESLTVLYADTRMELPPLQQSAMRLLDILRGQGLEAHVVLPEMDDRFFVYMFGRGVPPPKNRFRWCTPQLKVEPMLRELQDLRDATGEKLLMLTGVRLGESAARDQRIALSCSKDSGECGQGWFQQATPESVADTLAPLLHWRLCHVWDWLYFGEHGFDVADIAAVYGDGDVRTGCAGCNLVDRDTALEGLVKTNEWAHLAPLLELKPLYRELKAPQHRLRKPGGEMRKDGQYSKNQQRLGPLTMEAREMGLARVLDIQARAGVDLINDEELARIRELIAAGTWPNKWDGDEPTGNEPVDRVALTDDGKLVTQELML
jgi:DNA sulfur modification protein DndC